MPLNDTELLVVTTKTMRLSVKEALAYLKEKGHEMSKNTYYRILGRVSSETRKRLFEICKNFKEHHMQRIDEFEIIRKEMWDNYNECDDPVDRVKILKEIREILIYISAFEEAAAGVIEEVIKNFGKDHEDQIPSLSTLDGTGT